MVISSFFTATLAQTGNSTFCLIFTTPHTWIIDSEASDYMTGHKGIISTLHSILLLLPLILTNGSTFYTERVGITNATQPLSLSYVLYV